MPRPTAPKLTRLQTDLEKTVARLRKLTDEINSTIGNPMGSDVEICKVLRGVSNRINAATNDIANEVNHFDAPIRTLLNRQKPKGVSNLNPSAYKLGDLLYENTVFGLTDTLGREIRGMEKRDAG